MLILLSKRRKIFETEKCKRLSRTQNKLSTNWSIHYSFNMVRTRVQASFWRLANMAMKDSPTSVLMTSVGPDRDDLFFLEEKIEILINLFLGSNVDCYLSCFINMFFVSTWEAISQGLSYFVTITDQMTKNIGVYLVLEHKFQLNLRFMDI